ncbi:hypothetical protein VTO42DRAFT_4377 [Malbranchea cinnamomea]
MAATPMEPVAALVERWLDWDQDPETREEIVRLRDANDTPALERCLRKRIQFGTAGLRGRMQAGFSFMNSLTVIEASQGLAKFIKQIYQGPGQPSVVIGRDARHNSKKFADLAANAFVAEGIHVWWFDNISPTPFVPFAVLQKGATAGVMITASHNPPKDNGYKVYWSNGAQINSPIDVHIADSIEKNLEPWPTAWDQKASINCAHTDFYEQIMKSYCETVCNFAASTVETWRSPSPFVYTPLHGVGHATMALLCETMKITEIATVAEQKKPDPDFPTVKFPNPEEVGALDIAMKTADDLGRTLVIANDPDADRLSVAEKVNGTWVRFTGDQVGILLASHILEAYKEKMKDDNRRLAMLCTAVSTGMLAKMAEKEGFYFQETLTGFKWLGNVARDLESKGYVVPFAFEEALGYMFTPVCYDKDGLAAAMVFLAAEAKWRSQGLTPFAKLQQLYDVYGYHESLNTYFVSPDPVTTNELFGKIRRQPEAKQRTIGPLRILRLRNMAERLDSGTPDRLPQLPMDPNSQMLTIWSDHGVRFTIRASGTEPKVKIYIESCCSSRAEAIDAVCQVFSAVLDHWIRPFAPSMTFSSTLTTSSGHIFKPNSEVP